MIEVILLLIVAGLPTLLALFAIDSIAGHETAARSHRRFLATSPIHGNH